MPNGIIISTQTPSTGQTYPRRGGTATGLSQVTGLDVIRMHRDAKPTPEELELLKSLTHGSTIYITGHGKIMAESLMGEYQSIATDSAHVEQHWWSIDDYSNLIENHAPNLTRGMMLNIVLWVCHAGEGGENSTAARGLGFALAIKGIATCILASTDTVSRFDGVYDEQELARGGLRFRTSIGAQRLFFCCPMKDPQELAVSMPVFFTAEGFMPKLVTDLITNPGYNGTATRDIAISQLNIAPDGSYILRSTSIKRAEYLTFCVSMKINDRIIHTLWAISADNLLHTMTEKGELNERLEIQPGESLIDTLKHLIGKTVGEPRVASSTMTSSSSSSPASSSSSLPSLSLFQPLPKLIDSTVPEALLTHVYTKKTAFSLTIPESEAMLQKLVDLTLNECAKVSANGKIECFYSKHLSQKLAYELSNLRNKSRSGLAEHYRMSEFINFLERQSSDPTKKWTPDDRLLRVNLLSVFLGKPVSESGLMESIAELRESWPRPPAPSSPGTPTP